MSIRTLQEHDYDRYMELIDGFYHSSAVLHPVEPKNYDITFTKCVDGDPYTACLVYEDNQCIKGYALLSFTYSNEVGGMVVWVEEVYVPDEYRGQGIGTKLLTYIHDHYAETAKRFRLEVTRGNAGAIKLYESMGYEVLDYMQMTKDL